ncbi:hypothetical protein FOA43_003325 [Brettanomyces nanus]|uniref:Arrestin C-terminal-like domain-containing protein n=1 Tax=Eeniella nana TaxID=13502 RepID=A0A875S8C5_EENNA|nr:uncharacterized protein FOA43_003325 [Brettanomyces nanus]QPG75939.1 hypothetical protein FOA43_003325 [Brettanomyces nanus]
MSGLITSPLFPVEGLSTETLIKLPTKPNAASTSVKLYIIYAEPRLYLEGFSSNEIASRPPTVLRGCLFIRILKPVRIKTIAMKLEGVARTDWPEGIPPKKVEHMESKSVLSHTWPFFNYNNIYPVTDHSRMNADLFVPKSGGPDIDAFSLDSTLSPVSSNSTLDLHSMKSHSSFVGTAHANLLRHLSSSPDPELQSSTSRTRSRSDVSDNKLFIPGDYIYSFEQLFPASLPESMTLTFGCVHYSIEASLERSGAFKTNLYARRPVNIVRAPCSDSSEENEPIVINRDWEDRLHYEIVISSKQVILNSFLPISFRLTPLDKIRIHRLRIYITEHLEYFCHDKHVHRAEPPKKILLLEHKPPAGLDNLLAVGDDEIGGVQLDFQVYIPEYYGERYRIHPETCYDDIQSHHWIKICVRLSKLEPTPEDPNKRKHYELSIDSPIHILSTHCAHANTLLPSYDEQIREDVGVSDRRENLVDMNMSPNTGMILKSNLYRPDATIPVEMLSPQAKPFSPLVSPELNSINPELRFDFEMKPIDLLKTLSTVSRPLAPLGGPPPPFKEATTDNPPTYEEAVHGSTSSSSSSSSVSTSFRTEIEPNGRSRIERSRRGHRSLRADTYRDSADLGDMEGNFHLKVTPIRSRSTSSSPPPTLSQFSSKSRLVSTSLVPGMHFYSHTSNPSSPAIDAALEDSLGEDGDQPEDENEEEDEESKDEIHSPKSNTSATAAGSPKSTERDRTLSRSSTPTITRIQSNQLPLPTRIKTTSSSQLDGRRVSTSSTNSAGGISMGSEDPLMKRPLLSNDADLTVPPLYSVSANQSNPALLLRNGSIVTNLNYPEDPDSSMDISAMLGSSMDKDKNPIMPVGFDLAEGMGSNEIDRMWRPFVFNSSSSRPPQVLPLSHRKTTNKYSTGTKSMASRDVSEDRRKISFGVEPVLATLSGNQSSDEE